METEQQAATEPATLPVFDQGPPSGAEPSEKTRQDDALDKSLREVWDKIEGREQRDRYQDPAMPPLPAGTDMADTMRALSDWNAQPIEQRRAAAQAVDQVEHMREMAGRLGVKLETAADVAAFNQMMQDQAAPALPKQAKPVLDFVSQFDPGLGDDGARIGRVGEWIEHVKANPPQHGRQLMENVFGVHPRDMMSIEERVDDALRLCRNYLPQDAVAGIIQQARQDQEDHYGHRLIADFADGKDDFA
jgi:hypothetical protein